MKSNKNTTVTNSIRAVIAMALAWIVPGAGHAFAGRPWRGVIIFVAIGLTFWTGVAMGGVMTVDQREQKWWFAAQMFTGVHGLVGWQRGNEQMKQLAPKIQKEMARQGSSPQNEVRNSTIRVLADEKLALVAPMATLAQAYTGVAGLLNLMCVFDAIMLALIGTVVTNPKEEARL